MRLSSRVLRRLKLYPIVDWDERDVDHYLTAHDLPYHPLRARGYVSVGAVSTSRPLEPGIFAEQTRFFGLKRERGRRACRAEAARER